MKLLKLYSVTNLKSKTELLKVTYQFTDNDISLDEIPFRRSFLIEIDQINGTFKIYNSDSPSFSKTLKDNIVKSLIDYFTKTNMIDYLSIMLNKWE